MSLKIANGKIVLTENNRDTVIDIEWLTRSMRTAIKPVANRHSAYADKTREWIREIENAGIRAIPRIRREIKLFFGAREKGAAQCFKSWDYWLSMIWMATPKGRAQAKPDLYERNFEKIFKGEGKVISH